MPDPIDLCAAMNAISDVIRTAPGRSAISIRFT